MESSSSKNSFIDYAEAIGRALERAFESADNCRNIDRIARLVGCVNWPTADKRDKKGQKPALAFVVESDFSRTYETSEFPSHHQEKANSLVVRPLEVREEKPLQDINDLDQYKVSERTKRIVLNGRIADEPKENDNSDSIWLFEGLCALVRSGVPDEILLSIIKDERFAISVHVRKQGRRMNDYALRQLQRAKAATSDRKTEEWVTDKYGNIRPSYHNARVAIRRLGVICEFDTFHNRSKVGGHVLQYYQGELTDNACAMLRQLILETYGFDPKKDNVRDAIQQLCLENHVDPVREYVDSCTWDNVPRLDRMLSTYFGAPDTALSRAAGCLMMIAAVRRVREPGCKFDIIVVLEGLQGTGKSSALVILAGKENFSDQDILALDAKAQMEAVEGIWIYEISELEGLTRSEVSKVKAFASRQEDRARPAYGRFRENRPRRCIFVGTTNEEQYLRDRTGNRRFLPIPTGTVDTESLARDRDQLWAEAAQREAAGESIVLNESLWAEAARVQESRVEHDPWFDTLAPVEGERAGGFFRITSSQLLTDILQIPKERQNSAISKRLGHVMRQLGWTGPKLLRFGSQGLHRGYIRPVGRQGDLPSYIPPHPNKSTEGK